MLAQIAPWQIIGFVTKQNLSAKEHFNRLIQFRQVAYLLWGNAKEVAGDQLRRVCEQLTVRPLSLWNAEY